MMNQDKNDFSWLFKAIEESETHDNVVANSGISIDELESIRVLSEAVEETMEPPLCYFALS